MVTHLTMVVVVVVMMVMVTTMMIGLKILTPMMMIRFQLAGLQFRHGGGFGNPITLIMVLVLIAIITLGCGSQQQLH